MGRISKSLRTLLLVGLMMIMLDGIPRAVEAQQFGLVYRYAHLQGSRGDNGMSSHSFETLKTHDRRRLAAVVDFPLKGDDNVFITGLYYTQITLGTPPRQYYVQVDTGSDVLWINCAPCPSCPLRSDLKGVTLTQYDPSKSSTDKVLACASAECVIASDGQELKCTDTPAPGACAYSILYVDGSSTNGYFINDVLTFNQVANSTNSHGTANVYFGCGYNQTGNLQTERRAVDGLFGFGSAAIAVPTQLADQKKTGRVFAHCLQGDNLGGGSLVIGNILEANITYTPIVPRQSHYSVQLENISVHGMNVTTPASFEIALNGYGGGVILDSGTALSYLVQPAFDQFVAAISNNAPVPDQEIPDSSGSLLTCFIYSGNIIGTFPEVMLFFNGGAVMNLGPKNYLILEQLTTGDTAYCISWMESSTGYTIFGDIVLKDQLVVYDNDKRRVGWKPFDCTKVISVSTSNITDSMDVLPNTSRAQDSRRRLRTYLSSCCITLAFLCTLL